MLGIILIYFLGKAFYDLAGIHDKHQWGHAILGVVSYYVGTFIGGIAIVLSYELFLEGNIDDLDDFLLGLMAVPFGLLVCWVTYKILERRWNNQVVRDDHEDILDGGLL